MPYQRTLPTGPLTSTSTRNQSMPSLRITLGIHSHERIPGGSRPIGCGPDDFSVTPDVPQTMGTPRESTPKMDSIGTPCCCKVATYESVSTIGEAALQQTATSVI